MSIMCVPVKGPLADQAYKNQNPIFLPDRCMKFGHGCCFLPGYYSKYSELINEFEIRNDDVWICSFLKAGTTWVSELSWLLGHDLDYESAKVPICKKIPYLEHQAVFTSNCEIELLNHSGINNNNNNNNNVETSMQIAQTLASPRYIKTHLPWNMLPLQLKAAIEAGSLNQTKLIYIARQPKDVVVSLYHHKVLLEGYQGTMKEFIEEFVGDVALYCPYWTHIQEFWERRHQENVLFLTYEEMKKDLSCVVQKTAKFLGNPPLNSTQLDKLVYHLSFECMKSNPYVNWENEAIALSKIHGRGRKTHFMRKGQIGSWKQEGLSQSSIELIDEWIRVNKHKVEGLWPDIDL